MTDERTDREREIDAALYKAFDHPGFLKDQIGKLDDCLIAALARAEKAEAEAHRLRAERRSMEDVAQIAYEEGAHEMAVARSASQSATVAWLMAECWPESCTMRYLHDFGQREDMIGHEREASND